METATQVTKSSPLRIIPELIGKLKRIGEKTEKIRRI